MRQFVGAVIVLLLTLAQVAPAAAQDGTAPQPPADGDFAQVVAVVDGDTIKVDLGDGVVERLRYIGIDTPETVHPDEPVEPWGPQASAANERFVEGQVVLLERDVSNRDRYDRLLRYVWVETDDGWVMVNERLVALGLADVKAYEPDTRYHEHFLQIEERAREAGVGIHGPSPDARQGERTLLDQLLDFFRGRDA